MVDDAELDRAEAHGPAETNERAALQGLAAAGAKELCIGVEESRSQNIQGELRRPGRLLEAGRGSEDAVLEDRRLLIWCSQYRVEQTILAALETGVAVGGLGSREPPLSSRDDQQRHEYGCAR